MTARRSGRNMTNNDGSTATAGDTEAMDVHTPSGSEVNIKTERSDAFLAALGKVDYAQHAEQMPIADIGGAVNSGTPIPYSSDEIVAILEENKCCIQIIHEKSNLMNFKDMNVVYFMRELQKRCDWFHIAHRGMKSNNAVNL